MTIDCKGTTAIDVFRYRCQGVAFVLMLVQNTNAWSFIDLKRSPTSQASMNIVTDKTC